MDNVAELLKLLGELERRVRYRRIDSFFPDHGQDDLEDPDSTWSRHLYPKQLEFFEAGATYRQRLFSAANRIGKSVAGAYETVLHLTGDYPDWWRGRRFDYPVNCWIIGQTSETVQKILQELYLGPVGDFGSGLVPKDRLDTSTLPAATKVGSSVSGFKVKHAAGGYSTASLKSQEQGVLSFVGTSLDLAHVDEPLKLGLYSEICTRLAVRDGSLIITATPILGLDEMLLNFCGGEWKLGEIDPFRYVCSASWADVPHLKPEVKEQLLSSYPVYQRECRSKGIPMLGVGAVFPFSEEQISCSDFGVPNHWPRVAGLDVGWRAWAKVSLAKDPESGDVYVYSYYLAGERTPAEHVKAWGDSLSGIPICIDPASHGRGQVDGQIIFDQLKELGLDLEDAENAREAGILKMQDLFQAGKLRLFKSSCRDLITELLQLARLPNGTIRDSSSKHGFDALRYGVMGLDGAKVRGKVDSANSWTSGPRRW